MNIAPASLASVLFTIVDNVNLDSVMLTLLPVRQITPPFELDAPVSGSANDIPLLL